MWTKDPKTMTDAELDQHRTQIWERDRDITHEQDRRRALPFVWDNEEAIVKSLRAALGNAPKAGAAWQQPANITTAYLQGDTVTHDGKTWQAVGRGAILTAPGAEDPVQGEIWQIDDPIRD